MFQLKNLLWFFFEDVYLVQEEPDRDTKKEYARDKQLTL